MTHATSQDRYGDIVASPNGTVWISDPGRSDLIEIPTTGPQQRIPVGPKGNILYAAPDNSVWLGENGEVAHITSTGQVTQVPIPDGKGTANGFTTASDGTVWFTESADSKIAKIDPSTNQVSEYSDGDSDPASGIAAGPDGRLWYTVPYDDDIGAITTAGAASKYDAPATGPILNDQGSLRLLFMDGDGELEPLGIASVTPSSGTESGDTKTGVADGATQKAGGYEGYSEDMVNGSDGTLYTVGNSLDVGFGSQISQIAPNGGLLTYGSANGIVHPESGRVAVTSDGSIWTIALDAKSHPTIVERLNPTAAEPCVVPSVTGLSPSKATSELKAAHCGVSEAKITGPKDTPAVVRTQSKKADSLLNPGTKVKLTAKRGVLIPCGRQSEDNKVLRVTCANAAKLDKAIWKTAYKKGSARYHSFSCRFDKRTYQYITYPGGYVDCRAKDSKHRLREAYVFGMDLSAKPK
ncbi:MAG: PASTA domain-containing protein [Solirubrobacterales bacterium]|nr:PASTA domain-containing protein [Solirubrobacterales bacterium]